VSYYVQFTLGLVNTFDVSNGSIRCVDCGGARRSLLSGACVSSWRPWL